MEKEGQGEEGVLVSLRKDIKPHLQSQNPE